MKIKFFAQVDKVERIVAKQSESILALGGEGIGLEEGGGMIGRYQSFAYLETRIYLLTMKHVSFKHVRGKGALCIMYFYPKR